MRLGYSRGITRQGPSSVAFSGCSGSSPVTRCRPVETTRIARRLGEVRSPERLGQEDQAVEAALAGRASASCASAGLAVTFQQMEDRAGRRRGGELSSSAS